MANESTLTVRLKMVSDISDIQSNTSQIQKALNSLKLPDSLKNNFTKIFDDIEKESVKIAAIQNQTTKKPKDVTALESSFKKVNSLMYQLYSQMTKISPTMLQDSLKIDPAILQSAIAKVDELKQKLAEQIDTNSLDQVRKAVEDLTKEGKGGKTAPAFLEALETGKIEVAEGYLKSLQATLAGLRTRLGDNNQTVQLYSHAIGEMSRAFGQITSNGDIQKIRQDLEQANIELLECYLKFCF